MLELTAKHIGAVLGVPKHRIRVWTGLAPFAGRPSRARCARRFDGTDLLLMTILQDLEDRYGIRTEMLGRVATALADFLVSPVSNHTQFVVVDVETWKVSVVTENALLSPGFVIDINAARDRIADAFGISQIQMQLPFK